MAGRPDPFDLGLEGAVEMVLVDLLIFNEGVVGDQLAEPFRSDKIILLAVPFGTARSP